MTEDAKAIECRVNAARLISVASSLRVLGEADPGLYPHLHAIRETAEKHAQQLQDMARILEQVTLVDPVGARRVSPWA